MTNCFDCGQKLKDNYVGLINFGDPDHKCPERMFRHCPQCGTDLDMDNDHQWIPKKKVVEYREKLIARLFPKK